MNGAERLRMREEVFQRKAAKGGLIDSKTYRSITEERKKQMIE